VPALSTDALLENSGKVLKRLLNTAGDFQHLDVVGFEMIVDRAGTKSNEFGVVHSGISAAVLVSSPAITLDRASRGWCKRRQFQMPKVFVYEPCFSKRLGHSSR
jgi:hypothetical protein